MNQLECIHKTIGGIKKIFNNLTEDFLPKWLLLVSLISIMNSIQAYLDTELTKKVYRENPDEVTGLTARTFGTWTLVSGLVRLYGALYLYEDHIFQLTFLSFLVALIHFSAEFLIFRTCGINGGLMSPLIISNISLFWMYKQKEHYTGIPW